MKTSKPLFVLALSAAALVATLVPHPSAQGGAAMPAMKTEPAAFTPCLWFDKDGEAALKHYAAVFEGAQITSEMRAGGALISAKLVWRGHELLVVNGNEKQAFGDSMSVVVLCKDQDEIDRAWDGLVAGGKPSMCGWLVDEFGVSWQVLPESLGRLLGDPDPVKAKRVATAMFQMQKLDLAALERARDGR